MKEAPAISDKIISMSAPVVPTLKAMPEDWRLKRGFKLKFSDIIYNLLNFDKQRFIQSLLQ
jgi:hypothetical protein